MDFVNARELTSIVSFDEKEQSVLFNDGSVKTISSTEELELLRRRHAKALEIGNNRLTDGWGLQFTDREDANRGQNKFVVNFRDKSIAYLLDEQEHDDFLVRHDHANGSKTAPSQYAMKRPEQYGVFL